MGKAWVRGQVGIWFVGLAALLSSACDVGSKGGPGEEGPPPGPAPWELNTDREADLWSAVSAGLDSAGPTVRYFGGPTAGVAPLIVYVDGSRSRVKDGTWIRECRIEFGDGSSTENCWGEHTFPAGEFTTRFIATDSSGRETTAELVISVSDPDGTPTLAAGNPVTSPSALLPTDQLRWFGGEQGVAWARGVSVDDGGTVWAINDASVMSKAPDSETFLVHSGLGQSAQGDLPYTVCGGAGGSAYVGYITPDDLGSEDGSVEQRMRGDVDRIVVNAAGTASVERHFQIDRTGDAFFNDTQNIVSCVRQRDASSPDAGNIYFGSNHGITRFKGDEMGDHRHVLFVKSNGTRVIGYHRALTLAPDGELFFANDYKMGALAPATETSQWLSFAENPWHFDAFAPTFGPLEDADNWQAAAVTSDGRHWLGSRDKGLLVMTNSPRTYTRVLDAPDTNIHALASESDGSVWVATHSQGLWRYDGNSWRKLETPSQRIFGLYLDNQTSPRTLYIASELGVGIYRGP